MTTLEKILAQDFSEDFVQKMRNRIVMSHYKYGWMKDSYPEIADAIASLKQRLELYESTGNMEYLVDVANFAMIETMYPRRKGAYFKATDSDQSPGLVGGSIKEIMDEIGEYYKV